jgi:hypothetical protein
MKEKTSKLILNQETLRDLISMDPAFKPQPTPFTVPLTVCPNCPAAV